MFAIVITIYFLNVSKLDNKLLFSDNVVYIDYNIRKLNTILFSKSLNSDSLLNSQVDYVDSISSKINSEPNRIKTFKNNGNTLDTIGNRFLESDYTHSTSFVKVFYNAKSFYKVIDDTLCIYLNNKNVNNVNKIVKTKSDSLIIYTNEKYTIFIVNILLLNSISSYSQEYKCSEEFCRIFSIDSNSLRFNLNYQSCKDIIVNQNNALNISSGLANIFVEFNKLNNFENLILTINEGLSVSKYFGLNFDYVFGYKI